MAKHWNRRQKRHVDNTRRVTVCAIVAALSFAAIGIGLAEGAATNTPVLPGTSTTITKCTTGLTLSATKSPAKLSCAKAITPTTTTTTTTVKPPPTTTTTITPTTTTTTTAPTGGTCTKPSFTSSDAEATDNTDPGNVENFWVNNDAWSGSHGPQTINVCSASSWFATSTQPNNQGQIETYPDTEYDVGGRDASSTQPPTDPTIASYGPGTMTSTFSESNPSAGGWDAAYDLWTNYWSNETMVWNQWAGSNAFWPNCANAANSKSFCGVAQQGQAVTIGGVAYHFLANSPSSTTPCTTANEGDCELMWFRDTQVSSGSVDLGAIFAWEVTNGFAKATDVPTQLEYGTEVAYTTAAETFNVNGLTFNVSP